MLVEETSINEAYLATGVFIATYVAIASERVHKTSAALAGGMLVIFIGVLDSHEAFDAIDLNVIFLLAGMMVIANTMASTGVFQWLAVRTTKVAGGHPLMVLILLCLVTAVVSSVLDNVTTVVLIAPITVLVARTLRVPAPPMLIAEAIASNLGGAATLIGDPPNVLIGSHAGIGFAEFAWHVAPGAILALAAYIAYLWFRMRGSMVANPEVRAEVMKLDESSLITNHTLLRISLGVLALTLVGFVFHGPLGYEPAAVAMMGATLLLVVTRVDPYEALREVEWVTLFFFIGLFILVRSLEVTGVLDEVGQFAVDASGGSRATGTFLLLWLSAFASGIVDNIPYTATMLPVVDDLTAELGRDPDDRVLWWALTFGADFGGNMTIIGASANVLVANLAARNGEPISFWQFFRYGLPATILTVFVISGYLWVRYFLI